MKMPAIFRRREKALAPIGQSRGLWYPIYESYAGAWQSNVVVSRDEVLANPAIFACMTLIARDIAKLRVKLVEKKTNIWAETTSSAFSPVLRKPNGFQTRNQFWECWMLSKLSRGNTYVLKQRDQRGVVVALHVLDPNRVTPLVADDGSVFYDLAIDNLPGLTHQIIVPAREVIHDRFNCIHHPLVGLSPIFANGIAATQGLRIQDSSAVFFGNHSRPGGVLTAPGKIGDDTALRLKTYFETNFTGSNSGKVAVIGDGLKYESLSATAEDSQLVEQLKWTAEIIAATFHVPLYKLGMGPMPTNNNVQALNTEYYSQALQGLIEDAESCLDEGLGLDGYTIGTEFEIDNLLRMDSLTQMQVLKEAAGIMSPNEQRARLDLGPKPGGDSVYMQEQNWALEDLAKRSILPAAPTQVEPLALPAPDDDPDLPEDTAKAVFRDLFRKEAA